MIERYTRKAMGQVWAPETRFEKMLEVEVAVAKAQAKLKLIPPAAAKAIAQKGKFKVARILEIEKTTKHDVIAFVQNVAENVGEHGKYVHFALTSSDVLDTAFALQIRQAAEEILTAVSGLDDALISISKKHARTLCAGRTHGMHAEVTSFGVKMAGFLAELRRATKVMRESFQDAEFGKISGAVGTYTNMDMKVEEEALRLLKLKTETVATQVIPRDRHARVLTALALYGGFLERLAIELRHLQRTEVSEVVEDFQPGQKGSSAMPHKKNPISAENITGQARLLRAYAGAALENIALWHERDISHSSVERVVFPDAFIVADYATARMTELIKKLHVNKTQMSENMNLSRGGLLSSQALVLLVSKGMTRDEAYVKIQAVSHGLKQNENLAQALKKDKDLKSLVKASEWDRLASGKDLFQRFEKIVLRSIQERLK